MLEIITAISVVLSARAYKERLCWVVGLIGVSVWLVCRLVCRMIFLSSLRSWLRFESSQIWTESWIWWTQSGTRQSAFYTWTLIATGFGLFETRRSWSQRVKGSSPKLRLKAMSGLDKVFDTFWGLKLSFFIQTAKWAGRQKAIVVNRF